MKTSHIYILNHNTRQILHAIVDDNIIYNKDISLMKDYFGLNEDENACMISEEELKIEEISPMTMEEDYVSFDTALLLKKAGFRANLKSVFAKEENEWSFSEYKLKRDDYNFFDGQIACPTIALACKWIRKNLFVDVHAAFDHRNKSYYYVIDDMTKDESSRTLSSSIYVTSEKALEEGIKRAIHDKR